MAIDDTNAPKSVPLSGALSFGSTAGTDRSLNLLKNIKIATAQNQANSTLNEMRNFFRDYVGEPGAFDQTGASGTQANMSDFYGSYIYGFEIQAQNETPRATYHNNNNGAIRFKGVLGDRVTYTFKVGDSASQTVNHGAYATFTGLNTATNSFTRYNCSAWHRTPETRREVFIRKTFSGREEIVVRNIKTGDTQIGINIRYSGSVPPFISDYNNKPITQINFTGGFGTFSNTLYFLIGDQVPGGRIYGPSLTYP